MAKNDSNSGPKRPEEADPLSATAMFLKSFDLEPEGAKKPPDPFFSQPAAPGPGGPGNLGTDRPASVGAPFQPAAFPAQPAADPGEFTQLFTGLGSPQTPARSAVPPVEPPPQVATAVVKSPLQAQPEQSGGDVTRLFVPGATPASNTPPPKSPENTSRHATPPPPPPSSRSKGFSSPGVSDSASPDGSFTQFFSTSPAGQPARPAAPVQSFAQPAPQPSTPPPADIAWKDDPFFNPPAKPSSPDTPAPSITSMLSSLASPGTPPSGSRQPDPAPYRPEPAPSYAPAKPAPPASDPGGVTQLLRRLDDLPTSQAAAAPPAASAPPPSQGPGEFTRVISAFGRPLAGAPPAPPPARPAAPGASPFAPPPFAPPAPPPMPAMKPPSFPAVAPPPPAPAPSPGPAAFAAPSIPPLPKPAPPPLPALAPPKSKLEAMVPVLLVINTFLLVLLLVVVIFLIKAK
jgi:hypothetical protein